MTEAEVIQTFKDVGALLEGHFVYASGRHGEQFLQAARVLQYPEETQKLCEAMADQFRDDNIELVVGPATGGIILAYETARSLGCRGVFAEKEPDGSFAVKRGFAVKEGTRVLVVEDIVTTGGSVKKAISHLDACPLHRMDHIVDLPVQLGMLLEEGVHGAKNSACGGIIAGLVSVEGAQREQLEAPLVKERSGLIGEPGLQGSEFGIRSSQLAAHDQDQDDLVFGSVVAARRQIPIGLQDEPQVPPGQDLGHIEVPRDHFSPPQLVQA